MADELDRWMTLAREEDDQEAYARVVESCHHLLRASVLRETADTELADEIAQEVLVRAWAVRHQYRPGTSPRAWLLAIARTQLIEHHRRLDRNRRHMRDLVRQELLRHRDERSSDQQRADRLLAIERCMAEIPQRHRELLDLVHAKGLSTEAAADALGIKPPACRQRLSRIQRALRRCAEERLERA